MKRLIDETDDPLARAVLESCGVDNPPDSRGPERTLAVLVGLDGLGVTATAFGKAAVLAKGLAPSIARWLCVGAVGVGAAVGVVHGAKTLVGLRSLSASVASAARPASGAENERTVTNARVLSPPPVVAEAAVTTANPPSATASSAAAARTRAGPGQPYTSPQVHAPTPVIPDAPAELLPLAAAALPAALAQSVHESAAEPSTSAGPTIPSLRPELALLEQARTALATGRVTEAAALLDRHDREFPGGSFLPEATVLRIEMLLARGDRGAARALADRMDASNPTSPYARRARALVKGAQ
jgi:hypothetical protein